MEGRESVFVHANPNTKVWFTKKSLLSDLDDYLLICVMLAVPQRKFVLVAYCCLYKSMSVRINMLPIFFVFFSKSDLSFNVSLAVFFFFLVYYLEKVICRSKDILKVSQSKFDSRK